MYIGRWIDLDTVMSITWTEHRITKHNFMVDIVADTDIGQDVSSTGIYSNPSSLNERHHHRDKGMLIDMIWGSLHEIDVHRIDTDESN